MSRDFYEVPPREMLTSELVYKIAKYEEAEGYIGSNDARADRFHALCEELDRRIPVQP